MVKTSLFRGLAAAFIIATVSVVAAPVSAAVINPAAAGLAGSAFEVETFAYTDQSNFTFNFDPSGDTFTQEGILRIDAAFSGGLPSVALGLNTSYGLFFQFSNSAPLDITSNDPFGANTSFDYTLVGFNFNGKAGPGYTAADVTGPVVLGGGSLLSSTLTSTLASFTPNGAQLGAFPNGIDNAILFENGTTATFTTVAMSTDVPEPASLAVLLCGLGMLGMVSRKPKPVPTRAG